MIVGEKGRRPPEFASRPKKTPGDRTCTSPEGKMRVPKKDKQNLKKKIFLERGARLWGTP